LIKIEKINSAGYLATLRIHLIFQNPVLRRQRRDIRLLVNGWSGTTPLSKNIAPPSIPRALFDLVRLLSLLPTRKDTTLILSAN